MTRVTLLLALLCLPQVAAAQAETVEYYGLDMIGSIRVAWDPGGNVVGRQDYAPFGQRLSPSSVGVKDGFGSEREDTETQQMYFHARMFQSRVGRFSQPDPIVTVRASRYAYANNNPVRFVDFGGLLPMERQPCQFDCVPAGSDLPGEGLFLVVPNDPNSDAGSGPTGPVIDTPPTSSDCDGVASVAALGRFVTGCAHPDPPKPTTPTDCAAFAEGLTSFVLVTRGVGAAGWGGLGLTSWRNPWYKGENPASKMAGTTGFKPELIANNQGNDVYHHIVFEVAATLNAPEYLQLFVGVDAVQAFAGDRIQRILDRDQNDKAESQSELRDDIAGLKVSAELLFGILTNQTRVTQKMVKATLCCTR